MEEGNRPGNTKNRVHYSVDFVRFAVIWQLRAVINKKSLIPTYRNQASVL
jgi:hypothetical protein